jgi:hypothetical protein
MTTNKKTKNVIIISFDYIKTHKKIHDQFCEGGILVSLGVDCEFCALKKRINQDDDILIGEG